MQQRCNDIRLLREEVPLSCCAGATLLLPMLLLPAAANAVASAAAQVCLLLPVLLLLLLQVTRTWQGGCHDVVAACRGVQTWASIESHV
jgi:hypothetical protein